MPTALITGAGGGIGSAIATALAPTHSLLLAGRPSPRLDAVAQRLRAETVPLDLTDADAIRDGAAAVDDLDVLVHNAGVSIPSHVGDSQIEDWRATFDVNVLGAVALTLALLPVLRRSRGPRRVHQLRCRPQAHRRVWRPTRPASSPCAPSPTPYGKMSRRCG